MLSLTNSSYNVFSTYKCTQDNCSREYNSIKVFRKHLCDKYPAPVLNEVSLQVLNQEHLEEINKNIELDFNRNTLQQIDGGQNEQIDNIIHELAFTILNFKKAVFESSRTLVAKLYASTLNRSHVQEIIELILEFVSGNFLTMLKSKTLSILQGINQRQYDMQNLTEMFNIMQNIFQGLNTETKNKCT